MDEKHKEKKTAIQEFNYTTEDPPTISIISLSPRILRLQDL